jgi:alpha-mannosidase
MPHVIEMKYYFLSIFVSLCLTDLSAQQKKIYIAPDDHTDYMWSSNEEGYRNAFLETLDYYIKLNDSTADSPYAYQSKWNCDGSFWVFNYEKNRSEEEFAKLIRQIKDGKITVPLNTLAGVHGCAPAEATIREMYYAGSLERRFGLNLEMAINMEDQVMPLGLSSLWAGAGAKYSWHGVCDCVTKVKGFTSRPHEIYWYKGLDDQKILMKWYSLVINNKHLGGYAEARDPLISITLAKDLMQSPKYPYNIAGIFGKGWDDLNTTTREFVDVAKRTSDKDYQVIVSNEVDFFRDFEKEYGSGLPSETVSYGSTEWGISLASLADVSASVKRSIEKLRTAEALYTIVALKDKDFASGLKDKREKAWIACGLYFEHDWTADGPITKKQRADWARKMAGQLKSYVDTLYDMSLKRLGEMINKPGQNESFFVFNPLGWERSDYSDYPYSGSEDISIIDQTNSKKNLFQVITKENKKYIRVFAENIPPLGFKLFEIKKVAKASKNTPAANVKGGVIENDFYRITLTPEGVITSLIDKRTNSREYINPVNKLYFNDLGSGNGANAFNDMPMRIENEGPVSVTLVAESYGPVKHTSRITLFKSIDRIEIENCINQNLGPKPVTYSFSFNLKNIEIWHEEAGAILNVKPVSKGGHYAEKICRNDWLALNHFADMSDGGNGMMLSNRDAFFMKTGKSKVDSLDYTTPQINILAAGQVDAPNLGMINQDGESKIENLFALRPYNGAYDPASSMRFSLEHQDPLTSGKITGEYDRQFSVSDPNDVAWAVNRGYRHQFSLFAVSDPNVLVWAAKPAEEGIERGIILRIWNMGDKDSNCTISSDREIKDCRQTTHIEVDGEEIKPVLGKINTTVGHNRIQTFRVFLF